MPKETDYSVKAAEWRLLDTGNPAFRQVGYAEQGKNMQASYKVDTNESAEEYWRRVQSGLAARRRTIVLRVMHMNTAGRDRLFANEAECGFAYATGIGSLKRTRLVGRDGEPNKTPSLT